MVGLRQTSIAEPELALLRAVARGDDEAAAKLFRNYGDAVLRFIYRRVEDSLEDAQEIALDTFVTAVKLAGGFDPRSSVLTWLCGIAKVRIVDYYRKRTRSSRIPEECTQVLDELRAGSCTMEDVLQRIEAGRVVDAMLEHLSEDEREAVLLRYADGLSVREMSRLMGRSERGVDSLLTRAKSKARRAMGGKA